MDPKIYKLRFRYKIWLETPEGDNVFGDGKCRLLRAIEETGSLKAAIEKLGLSYRKTWDNLKKIEQVLGFPVLDATRGGADGGKTELTTEGKFLLKAFEEVHHNADGIFRDLTGDVLQRMDDNKEI